MWPEDREASARANLRQLLWQIKKALGVELILADKINVGVNPETPFTLDADQLAKSQEGSPALDKRLEALSLYAGELLPGFYDEWIIPERERLGRIYDQQMSQATQDLEKEKRWRDVLVWGEKWIANRRGTEVGYRALIRAYAALGDTASAVAVYQRCAADLKSELGVSPSQETQSLLTQVTQSAQVEKSPEKSNLASKAINPNRIKNRSTQWVAALIFGLILFLAVRFLLSSLAAEGNPSLISQSILSAGADEGCTAAEVLAFSDDFEARQTSNWLDMDLRSSGFSYIEDPENAENTVIQMLGSPNQEVGSTSTTLPENFVMRLRFRLETEVSLAIGLNSKLRNHWYQIILGPPGENPPQLRRITPEEETTVRSLADSSMGEWHLLEISIFGSAIEIWNDGQKMAMFQDAETLSPVVDAYIGMFAYAENSRILLDNIFVCKLDSPFRTILSTDTK